MLISAQGISHNFGSSSDEARLFAPKTFQITAGQILGVTGPSGCGKSTLLSILAGWVSPSEGTLERLNVNQTCMVLQTPAGSPRRTALDHVVLPMLAQGSSRRVGSQEATILLGRFGLAHVSDYCFRLLSGGEAQRLMLARAVAAKPDLLLVDEPTAQLDLKTGAQVISVLHELRSSGCMVVIATHDGRAERVCDSVVNLAV